MSRSAFLISKRTRFSLEEFHCLLQRVSTSQQPIMPCFGKATVSKISSGALFAPCDDCRLAPSTLTTAEDSISIFLFQTRNAAR